jgi:bile acid:Na+ symporter, BASS family
MLDFIVPHIPVLLRGIVVVIMFVMGISLTVADFKRIVLFPKAALLGLSGQLVIFPIVGFIVALLLPLPPEIKMGLILIAACPDGATSNAVSHISKGDVALAVTLTAFSSILNILTIPFIVNLGLDMVYGSAGASIKLDVLDTLKNLFLITILPVAVGMLLRRGMKNYSDKTENFIATVAGICIIAALTIFAKQLSLRGSLWDFFVQTGPAVVLLNLLTLFIGFTLSGLVKLPMRQRVTISIEAAVQNGTIGILIANNFLKKPEMATPSMVYGILMCVISLIVFPIFRTMVLKNDER